jgi:stage II sporulation protein P
MAILVFAIAVVKICFVLSDDGTAERSAVNFAVSRELTSRIVAFEFGGGKTAAIESSITKQEQPQGLTYTPPPLQTAERETPLIQLTAPPVEPPQEELMFSHLTAKLPGVLAATPKVGRISRENGGIITPAPLKIDNSTSLTFDADALLADVPAIKLIKGEPQILILHTHGSEAFAGVDGYRSLDKTLNVVRVGDALATELQNRGFSVIHDRDINDYPSYNGSYLKSEEAAKAWIAQYPSIQVVFDVHRDSVEYADGSVYRTLYSSGGEENTSTDSFESAQVMIIATNGEKGMPHPNWKENLKLALDFQTAANAAFPGLMRPLYVSGQRFNEQLAPGYLLLEVGSTGNTIEEATTAVRLFAEAIEPALSELKI